MVIENFKKPIKSFLFLVVFILIARTSNATDINFNFKKLDIAENLSFTGASRWDYKIKQLKNNKIQINFPHKISANDLKKIKSVKGKYVKNLKVKENDVTGSKVILQLQKNSSYFDYLTDQPSSLVIDFYEDKTKVKSSKKTAKNSNKNKVKKINSRMPASTEFISFENVGNDSGSKDNNDANKMITGGNGNSLIKSGVFDAADPDYERFNLDKKDIDNRIVNKNLANNAYVRFPILYRQSNQLSKLLSELPLHVIKAKDKKETKEAQLIHKLYTSKTWAAFNKMYEYFNKTYPNSKYKNILRSLATSSYYELWKQTSDKQYLKMAKEEFLKFKKELPENRVTEFWDKVMFYTALELGEGLEAARMGEAIISKYPIMPDKEQIKLNLADSYLQASQYKEADRVYSDLINESPNNQIRKLASFTKPIVDLKQKKSSKGIEKYLEAKKEHMESDDPSYYFNMGESYFWKGDYLLSAQLFRQFIRKYPKHIMNSFAITRIGEIKALVGEDKSKYQPLYLESVYRFRGHKGADIAEMRINSLKVLDSKKNEGDHYISEIERLANKYDETDMTYFKEITIADALAKNGRYIDANKYIKTAFKRNPYAKISKQIKRRILDNLDNKMKSYLDDKEYLSSIELFEKNRVNWLNGNKRPSFKKNLARSFELAGLDNYALAHYVDYVEDKKKSKEEVDNQVILSMATLYQKNKDYDNMDKYLKILSDTKNLKEDDKFKAIKLKFEVYNEKAIYDRAENLLKAYNQSNIDDKKIKTQTTLMMSDFYENRGRFKDALSELKNIESEHGKSSEHFYPLSKRIIQLQVKNGNESDAINKTDSIIDLKEFKKDESFVFYIGNLLINNNERKKGEKVWSLIDEKKSLYANMIDEKVDHLNWKKDYKKYIDRIPAMSK